MRVESVVRVSFAFGRPFVVLPYKLWRAAFKFNLSGYRVVESGCWAIVRS